MTEQRKPYKIDGRPSTIYRVVKNKDNPYVMIDRRPVDNPKLSFKAKGILTYLLSRPDGWEVSVADLIKHGMEGEAAVRSGLKELKLAGHMRYTNSRQQGRITGWLIEVFEFPLSPDGDFQDVEKQDVENRTQVLSTSSRKKKASNIKTATPKPTTPKASDFPELVLHREIVSHWCKPHQREIVIDAIQKINTRLCRPAIKDDLVPFWTAWGKVSGNDWSLVWLTDWAVSGKIPQSGPQTQKQSNFSNTVDGLQKFLANHPEGAYQNG